MSVEINPNSKDHNFYGKTIGQFTEEEKELFQVDLMMSMGFSVLHLTGGKDEKLINELNKMGTIRTTIILELLEIPEVMYKIMGFREVMEIIEESPYGFSKFLKSQDENIKEHLDEMVDDIKRDSLINNISYN